MNTQHSLCQKPQAYITQGKASSNRSV